MKKPRKPVVYPTIPMIRRMQQLRRAGLSAEAVRTVIEIDYGQSPCSDSIRKYTSGWAGEARAFVSQPGTSGMTSGPHKRKAI